MSPPPDLRGAVLGRGYRLVRAAGVAYEDDTVFDATHERVPGRSRVRLFPAETLSRPDAAARIHQAARLASLVRAPEAVQLLDFNLAGDVPAFVVTERVEGRTLAAALAEDGMLSLPATVEILGAVAAAVHAAHRLGLPHGDLRAPLIVLPDGAGPRAKVEGFGWARELRAAATRPAAPGLLAPEQHAGRVVTIDPRADQYALAGLAYEMLAACAPFPDEPDGDDRAARVPSPLGELAPGIPDALDEVLRRALSHRPRDRFEDILELAARLREAAAAAPVTIPLAALPSLAVGRGPTRPGRPSATPEAAAQPRASATDITEEMDEQTLWPLVAKADGSGDVMARIQREESLDLDLLGHAAGEAGHGAYADVEIGLPSAEVAIVLPSVDVPPLEAGTPPPADEVAAMASLLDGPATPPPEVATLVRLSPFILPAVETPAETPPPEAAEPTPLPRPAWLEPAQRPRATSSWPAPATAVPAAAPRPGRVFVPREAEAPGARAWAPRPVAAAAPARMPGLVPAAPPARGRYDSPAVQAVEINLDTPPPAPPAPPPVRRTWDYVPQQPFRMPEAPPAHFRSDAYLAPPRARGARGWKATAAALAFVAAAALGAGVLLLGHFPFALGGGAPPRSPPATAAPAHAPAPTIPAVAAAPAPRAASPIIAPVDSETVDPLWNGRGACAVDITSTPPARVWIDGRAIGHPTPLDGFRVHCGLHRLLLQRTDTGLQFTDILNVVPSHPFTADYSLD